MADFDLKKFFLNWRMYLLAVLVAAVVVAILWGVPPLLVEQVTGRHDTPDAHRLANLEDAYRRTLAQILGGLALLYGLYLTQRRIVATEDNVRVAQEGQVTERFTRAIEQLGHTEMAIRLGGIYALERLAKDSEKDHGPIMEVLTAYVREKAPSNREGPKESAGGLTTDIQAILTVIGRRETTGNRGNDHLALNHTRLPWANLIGADLHAADLAVANLTEAELTRANLIQADLYATDLTRADLMQADLSEANMFGADLTEADLTETKLTRAKLTKADLTKADLTRADLTEADLRDARNLTADQVQTAKNWHEALLPDYLKDISEPSA